MNATRAPTDRGAGALRGGLVVASHGRHCVVQAEGDGARVICHPRGKKSQVVVGDRVRWQPSGDEGRIERVEPRRNLLYRQDALRSKQFAANLDQVLILLGAEPVFSEHQLARALIAAVAARIEPLIGLNKRDLAAPFASAWQRLAPYRAMGYAVLPLALAGVADAADAADSDDGLTALRARLDGRVTLVLGPSGAGKSTLVNRLVPGAAAETAELSRALGSGRHTTTDTRWYWLDAGQRGALIDSPGFQEFGLHHIEAAQLAAYMPDLRPHVAACRFYNCTHLHEPGCGVMAQVQSASGPGAISKSRYAIYSDLYRELSAPPQY